jgi:hypothetical protein
VRGGPGQETKADFAGDVLQFGFDPLFLGRDQVKAGIPGPDVIDDSLSHDVLFPFSD